MNGNDLALYGGGTALLGAALLGVGKLRDMQADRRLERARAIPENRTDVDNEVQRVRKQGLLYEDIGVDTDKSIDAELRKDYSRAYGPNGSKVKLEHWREPEFIYEVDRSSRIPQYATWWNTLEHRDGEGSPMVGVYIPKNLTGSRADIRKILGYAKLLKANLSAYGIHGDWRGQGMREPVPSDGHKTGLDTIRDALTSRGSDSMQVMRDAYRQGGVPRYHPVALADISRRRTRAQDTLARYAGGALLGGGLLAALYGGWKAVQGGR